MRVEAPHLPWGVYGIASFCIMVGVICLRVDRPFNSGGIVGNAWQANLVGIVLLVVGIKHFIQATARYFRNRHRYARVVAAQCARCGYDLSGNASGRCPECGESIEPLYARNFEDELSSRWFSG